MKNLKIFLLILAVFITTTSLVHAQDFPPAQYVTVDTSGFSGVCGPGDSNAQVAIDTLCSVAGTGAVDSVFGRTGVVVAVSGDYSCNQVTGSVCDTGNQNIDDLKTFTTDLPQSSIVPASADDLVNKAYVDAFAQGLTPKNAVTVATVTAGTLASDFENGDTVDGESLVTGERILIKDQASAVENGIYTVNVAGAPTRALDSDTSAEVMEGTFTYVLTGTVNENTQWVQYEIAPTINVDPLNYRLLSVVNAYTASNGITLSTLDFQLGGTLTQSTTIGQGVNDMIWDLTGTGTFSVEDGGQTSFIVDANNQIGIGTATPASTLHTTTTSAVVGPQFVTGTTFELVSTTPPSLGEFKIYQTDYSLTNDAGGQFLAARQSVAQIDPTAGSEAGLLGWGVADNSGSLDIDMTLQKNSGISVLSIGATGGDSGLVTLGEPGGNSVTLGASSAAAAGYTLRFPPDAGAASEVLTTDGSGNTSWAAAGSLISASNGLNITGTDVRLGGTLIQNTTIDVDTFDLAIDLTTSGDFRVDNNGTTNPALFVENASGDVGIGTDAPGDKLHVEVETADPTIETTLLRLDNVDADPTSSSTSDIDFYLTNDTSNQLNYAKVRGSSLSIVTGDEVGALSLSTIDGDGNMIDGVVTYNVENFLGQEVSVLNIGTSTYRALLSLQDGDGEEITIFPPNALAAGWNWVLPPNNGNPGDVLTTDGAGTTTWTAASGGGITDLNGETGATQSFATGTAGTDFAISSALNVHTFDLPVASGTNTGKLSNTDWTTFNSKQNQDALLNALAANTFSGIMVLTGNDTYTTRNLVAPAAGFSISNSDGVAAAPTFTLTDDLAAVEGLATTGMTARTAANTWTTRTLSASTATDLSWNNADGVAGNPVVGFTRSANFGSALGAGVATFGGAGTPLIFEGTTADTFQTAIVPTDPTVDRTITLPNASGTVAVSATSPVTLSAAGDIGVNATLQAFGTYNTNGLLTQTAANTFTGRTIGAANAFDMTITNGNGVAGNPSLAFARTATTGSALSANQSTFSTTGVIFEGTTANAFQTLLQPVDPTADRTINIPNNNGTFAVQVTAPLTLSAAGLLAMPVATGAANGYLSSANFTTFNNKIGGSGTTNYVPKFTAAGTIGDSVMYQDSVSGKLGVNTTTPESWLNIINTAATPADLDVYLECEQGGAAPQFCSGNFLTRNAARATTLAGDSLATFGAFGSIGGNVAGGSVSSLPTAQILMEAESNYTGSSPYVAGDDRATSIIFQTADNVNPITERMRIDGTTGFIGISDSTPGTQLDVSSSGATVATFNRNTNDGTLVDFQRGGVSVGSISVAAGVTSYNPFTGAHYIWNDSSEPLALGVLLEMTGNNKHKETGEIIYGVRVAKTENSKAILGSYLSLQEPSQEESMMNPGLVMAVGNGIVYVSNTGSDIEPGDLLTSSSTAGCAQKIEDKGFFSWFSSEQKYVFGRAGERVEWKERKAAENGCVAISVLFDSSVVSN